MGNSTAGGEFSLAYRRWAFARIEPNSCQKQESCNREDFSRLLLIQEVGSLPESEGLLELPWASNWQDCKWDPCPRDGF